MTIVPDAGRGAGRGRARAARADEERAQRQRLEDELKDAGGSRRWAALAGSVAHDFGNILAVISGHGELMLGAWTRPTRCAPGRSPSARPRLWGLEPHASRPGHHARRSGRRRSIVDLNVVIASVVRTLQPLLGERVDVVLRLEPRLGRVNVNVVPLEQAIIEPAARMPVTRCRWAAASPWRPVIVGPESGNGGGPHLGDVPRDRYRLRRWTPPRCLRAFEPVASRQAAGPGHRAGAGHRLRASSARAAGGSTPPARWAGARRSRSCCRRRPTPTAPADAAGGRTATVLVRRARGRAFAASSSARSSSCTATTSSPRATWTRRSASACHARADRPGRRRPAAAGRRRRRAADAARRPAPAT